MAADYWRREFRDARTGYDTPRGNRQEIANQGTANTYSGSAFRVPALVIELHRGQRGQRVTGGEVSWPGRTMTGLGSHVCGPRVTQAGMAPPWGWRRPSWRTGTWRRRPVEHAISPSLEAYRVETSHRSRDGD
jgi:hypothetical protein